MIKILKGREAKESKDFSLLFERKSEEGEVAGCDFAFPCDFSGDVYLWHADRALRDNYQFCLNNPHLFHSPYVQVNTHHWTEPAIGECICGTHIILSGEYYGATQCPTCGRWYNIYGQSLKPPKQWENDPAEEEY